MWIAFEDSDLNELLDRFWKPFEQLHSFLQAFGNDLPPFPYPSFCILSVFLLRNYHKNNIKF